MRNNYTGFGGSLDLNAIVEFIDSGRNVLLAANSVVSDTMRALAAEVGVEIDEKGTKVFDHFYHAKRIDQAPDHNLIAATDVVSSKAILPNGVKVCDENLNFHTVWRACLSWCHVLHAVRLPTRACRALCCSVVWPQLSPLTHSW